MTDGGPSTSGKPWPRLTAPVETASADIREKIVGAMPWSLVASTTARLTTMDDAAPDPTLAGDIDAICRLSGQFTLRSGQVSSEYFDKYLFESQPALLARVAAQMERLLPADTDLLGGLELGGIPIATMVSARTGLPALFVRKKAKEYGTCKLAEGPARRRPAGDARRGRHHHGRRRPRRDPRAT